MILILTMLATLLAGYYGWRSWLLLSDGATTTSLSLKAERQTFTGKNPSALPYRYYAEYTFADGSGQVRSSRQTIDRRLYETLTQRVESAPVVVHYSRSKPYVNTLDPQGSRSVFFILAAISLVGWGIVILRGTSG